MTDLIQRARTARREGRLSQAKEDLASAVSGARGAGCAHTLGMALSALAQIERDLGHAERSQDLYREAVDIFEAEAEPRAIAHAARHLGDLYREAGRLDEAGCYLTQALVINRARADCRPLELANSLRPLALLREDEGRVRDAVHLWKEARALYAAEGVRAGVEECSSRLEALGHAR